MRERERERERERDYTIKGDTGPQSEKETKRTRLWWTYEYVV